MNPEELKRLLDAYQSKFTKNDELIDLGNWVVDNAPAILALVEENARLREAHKQIMAETAHVSDDLTGGACYRISCQALGEPK